MIKLSRRIILWLALSVGLIILMYNYIFRKVNIQEILNEDLVQNDEKILRYIWENEILHPANNQPYNLRQPTKDPSMGQSKMIIKALDGMKNGFFVECGALDGETRSNTLVFERNYGWNGLLIEADPKNFQQIMLKQRKAWAANACLATKPYPHEVLFEQNFNIGKISSNDANPSSENLINHVRVQCFPLFSLLSALNITTVDYFSLDVEGFELDVLKTIPFDAVNIKVLSVEYIHGKEGKSAMKEFMQTKGYTVYGEVNAPNNLANDYIFIHNTTKVK